MQINNEHAHSNSHNYTLDMDGNERFAENLRRLRQWKDISQAELGKLMNVTDTTISAWENKKLNRVPSKSTIDTLVEIFKNEIKQTNINLYEDAGYYTIENIDPDKLAIFEKSISERLDKMEQQLDLLVEAYRVDHDVQD